MTGVREKISREEAAVLEQRARHKELVSALKNLDSTDGLRQLAAQLQKLIQPLVELQTKIDELKAKAGEPIMVQPQITVDTAELGTTLSQAIATMEARLQHELAKLQAREEPKTMHIEFTRSQTGYIQSPIIVKPV